MAPEDEVVLVRYLGTNDVEPVAHGLQDFDASTLTQRTRCGLTDTSAAVNESDAVLMAAKYFSPLVNKGMARYCRKCRWT